WVPKMALQGSGTATSATIVRKKSTERCEGQVLPKKQDDSLEDGMGLRVNTNIQSLAAQRSLGINYNNQKLNLEHLSSGSRIVRAADDAAGLAISEKMKSHIRSLGQATRNAGDGISMIQTAEGAMNEVGNILTRFRELSIQAASDTIGDVERSFIDKEVQQLGQEIDR